MALTIKEVDNAKSNGKPYRLADGGGLCLFVAPIYHQVSACIPYVRPFVLF
jgi:hypothetical protein